jgi:cell pole-organizing protein PopZ
MGTTMVRRSAPALAPIDGATVENVFERAVRESFEPVLQKYIADNSSVVIERMKPLIREWMDEHFPALLEGAVRNEVARVVKARGR